MLTIDAALAQILDGITPLEAEEIGLENIAGRINARAIEAQITHPPFRASAMDGYAVLFADMAQGAKLSLIDEAPAGSPSDKPLRSGQAIRVFTGSVIPDRADHVVIQEHVSREHNTITIEQNQSTPRHIRDAGIDFHKGDILLKAGEKLHEIHASLLASANLASIFVTRKPDICVFSCGDELIDPGSALEPGQIINSNHYALCGLSRRWGAKPHYQGCAPDRLEAITDLFKAASQTSDIIVVTGGASVGDYDYVKPAFAKSGGTILFENVAMKPGKPIWFGHLNRSKVLGLPGNPASAIVGAILFLHPLISQLSGHVLNMTAQTAYLDGDLPPNSARESLLRATLKDQYVTPASNQDSSLLSPFIAENIVLIRRPAHAEALRSGAQVPIIRI